MNNTLKTGLRLFALVAACALCITSIVSCVDSRQEIRDQATSVQVGAQTITQASEATAQAVTAAKGSIFEIDRAADRLTNFVQTSDTLDDDAALKEIREKAKSADQNLTTALGEQSKIVNQSKQIEASAATVNRLTDYVENKNSIWDVLRRVLIVAIPIAVVIAVIFTLNYFGLGGLMKSLGEWFTSLVKRLVSRISGNWKWDNVAKMAKETVTNETTSNEFIAALRGYIPALDRAMKKEADNPS